MEKDKKDFLRELLDDNTFEKAEIQPGVASNYCSFLTNYGSEFQVWIYDDGAEIGLRDHAQFSSVILKNAELKVFLHQANISFSKNHSFSIASANGGKIRLGRSGEAIFIVIDDVNTGSFSLSELERSELKTLMSTLK